MSGAVVAVARWLVRATDDRVVTASNPVRLPHITCVFRRHNKQARRTVFAIGAAKGVDSAKKVKVGGGRIGVWPNLYHLGRPEANAIWQQSIENWLKSEAIGSCAIGVCDYGIFAVPGILLRWCVYT